MPKAMVAAHRGIIKAESHGKDQGATFIVTLETVAMPAVAAPDGAKKTSRRKTGVPRIIFCVCDTDFGVACLPIKDPSAARVTGSAG